MDDFSDLFFDQDVGALSQRTPKDVESVPAPPPSTDNIFLSQAFQAAHKDDGQFPFHQPETKKERYVPSFSQSKVRKTSSMRSPEVGVVSPLQVSKTPRQLGPRDGQATGAFRTPFIPPRHTPRVNVTPVTENNHTPRTLELAGVTPGGSERGMLRLRPVSEIPEEYQAIFPFPYFNAVQSQVLDDVLYTNRPVVVCAPTGSGKTALFELAIIRLIMINHGSVTSSTKIVYMAPIKALCTERFEDWQNKFGPLGLKCKELTGDTELDDYFELQDVNIILTTPEKWDSMTRRWRDNKSLVKLVRLFFVDEVHMLNDNTRGPTMEAVVSRMKTINSVCKMERSGMDPSQLGMRFIAVSATIPNASDVGEWLSTDSLKAACHKLDESHRPVRLRKVVLGFPCSENQSEFRFDLSLNYKLAGIIETYSDQKPTLVFCATRKGVQQAATTLVRDARFILNSQHKSRLTQVANGLRESKLREVVMHGVGYHHAGLDMQDRKAIESIFTAGDLPVLMATSTLAMGVNLPAHLVIVKSTQHYVMGGYAEYSETGVLQMIGRAGRPQFDTTATAVIMTRSFTKHRYEALINGMQRIESSLHQNLVEHLNAEVVLNTISDVSVAVGWIKSTFLYTRIMKNPTHYGLTSALSNERIEQKLQDLCLQNLNSLAEVDLIKMDQDGFGLKSTETGRLMARYCIAFGTMKQLQCIEGAETISDLESILTTLCSSQEFKDIQLRNNEKKVLNTLNRDKNRTTIRFPMDGKIKTNYMKVNCLIQSSLGCLTLQDFALSSDTAKIFRSVLRISKCLVEVLWNRPLYKSFLNAVLLSKCLKARLWENSRHISRQLPGIGEKLANMLVNAGVTTFQKLEETNPREIELIVNRHPPFGNQVKHAVSRLPKYELCINQVGAYLGHAAQLTIKVTMVNAAVVKEKSSASLGHSCVLLVGDADNKVVYRSRVSDSVLVVDGGAWIKRVDVRRAERGEDLNISIISQDFVGLDVHSNYTPFYTGPKRVNRSSPGAQHPAQTVKEGNVPQQEKSCSRATVEGPSECDMRQLAPGRRICSHHCINKATCAHDCCKYGVAVRGQRASLDVYRHQLKQRATAMPQTPNIKRLKTDSGGPQGLGQFNYTPKSAPQVPRTLGYSRVADSGDLPRARAMVTPSTGGWEELDLHQQRASASTEWFLQEGYDEENAIDCNAAGCQEEENPWPGSRPLPAENPFTVEDFQAAEPPAENHTLPDLEDYRRTDRQSAGVKSSYFTGSCGWDDPVIIDDWEEDGLTGMDANSGFGTANAPLAPCRTQSKFASLFTHKGAIAKGSTTFTPYSNPSLRNSAACSRSQTFAGTHHKTTCPPTSQTNPPGFQKASLLLATQGKNATSNYSRYMPKYHNSESDSDFEEMDVNISSLKPRPDNNISCSFKDAARSDLNNQKNKVAELSIQSSTKYRNILIQCPKEKGLPERQSRPQDGTPKSWKSFAPRRSDCDTFTNLSPDANQMSPVLGGQAPSREQYRTVNEPMTGKQHPQLRTTESDQEKNWPLTHLQRGASKAASKSNTDTVYEYTDDIANFSLCDYDWSDPEDALPLQEPTAPSPAQLPGPPPLSKHQGITCKPPTNVWDSLFINPGSTAAAASSSWESPGQTRPKDKAQDAYIDIFAGIF